jgi:diaminopimelate epimerase
MVEIMIKYAKYHGCGNDFIITGDDDVIAYRSSMPELARRICNRSVGVGADGLIVLDRSPLRMSLWNADGSIATMCGNGIRCVAAYCYDEELTPAHLKNYSVETLAGKIDIEITQTDPFECKINIGKNIPQNVSSLRDILSSEYTPSLRDVPSPEYIPSLRDLPSSEDTPSLRAERSNPADEDFLNQEILLSDGTAVNLSVVYNGTNHAVIFIEQEPWTYTNTENPSTEGSSSASPSSWAKSQDSCPSPFTVPEIVTSIGKQLDESPQFPGGINVDFARILTENVAQMITYERGAGLTAACGTGACAVAAVGSWLGKLTSDDITLKLPYGELKVQITEKGETYLTGPAQRVAIGKYYG